MIPKQQGGAIVSQAEIGDRVKVRYQSRLKDGTRLVGSQEDRPIEFTLGRDRLIEGFQRAVLGMREGQTKTVAVPPEEAFGRYREELVREVDRSRLPEGLEPRAGMTLRAEAADVARTVWIRDVEPDRVIVDANHPFAGVEIVFEIELVEAEKPGTESSAGGILTR